MRPRRGLSSFVRVEQYSFPSQIFITIRWESRAKSRSRSRSNECLNEKSSSFSIDQFRLEFLSVDFFVSRSSKLTGWNESIAVTERKEDFSRTTKEKLTFVPKWSKLDRRFLPKLKRWHFPDCPDKFWRQSEKRRCRVRLAERPESKNIRFDNNPGRTKENRVGVSSTETKKNCQLELLSIPKTFESFD